MCDYAVLCGPLSEVAAAQSSAHGVLLHEAGLKASASLQALQEWCAERKQENGRGGMAAAC
jgi:hypothetical protein